MRVCLRVFLLLVFFLPDIILTRVFVTVCFAAVSSYMKKHMAVYQDSVLSPILSDCRVISFTFMSKHLKHCFYVSVRYLHFTKGKPQTKQQKQLVRSWTCSCHVCQILTVLLGMLAGTQVCSEPYYLALAVFTVCCADELSARELPKFTIRQKEGHIFAELKSLCSLMTCGSLFIYLSEQMVRFGPASSEPLRARSCFGLDR